MTFTIVATNPKASAFNFTLSLIDLGHTWVERREGAVILIISDGKTVRFEAGR